MHVSRLRGFLPGSRAFSLLLIAALLLITIGQTGLQPVQAGGGTPVFINEIHYDNASTDVGEAIEVAGPAGTDLTGWSLALYNGSNNLQYDSDALSGTIPDQCSGYGTVVITYPTNGIQNGAPDGIALVDSMSNVIQFLSYEGSFTAADGPANGMTSTDIGVAETSGTPIGNSLQLTGDGTTYEEFTWQAELTATFGDINDGQTFAGGCAATDPLINEFVRDHTGSDTNEFIEIYGDPNTDYSAFTVVEIEGEGTGVGLIDDATFTLGTTDANGYWYTGFLDNVIENGTNSFLLVENYTGAVGNDIDTDDDGVIDVTYWDRIVDSVAVIDGAGEITYGAVELASGYDGIAFEVGGASRIPNATDTDTTADWMRNDYDGAGIPALDPGSPVEGEAYNTPGAENEAVPPTVAALVINEIDYDQPSTDTAEFVEIRNNEAFSVNLDNYALQLVNGNGAVVYQDFDLPNVSLAAGDYYVVCANAANTVNCDLDVSPDENLIQNGAPDAVALVYNGATIVDVVSYEGDVTGYTETTGIVTGDGSDPAIGLSRYPDGSDTDVNDADFSLRCITPGEANTADNTNCEPAAALEIWEIQGAAHLSPYNGQAVTTADNIVTAVGSSGFWMQTPDARADADVATSNGILVYTGGAPTVSVGDQVDVSGTVAEYRPGGSSSGNLTTTEITGPTVTIDSSGNTLPAAIVIGTGGRVPPAAVIDDDATGDVESSGTFDATTDGIDFYESLEGMLVQVNNAQVVGETSSYNETWVVGDLGANATTLTPRGGVVISNGDFNPERIQLDDTLYPGGSAAWPDLNVGARLTSPAIGVLDFNFGNFEVLVTQTYTVDTTNEVTPEVTTLTSGVDQLTVATFNVENLGPDDGQAAFDARAAQIVNNLLSPDIIVLEEMQDNSGDTNDGTVNADVTFQTLIDRIVAAGGPTYSFAQIDPVDGQDGGIPGGNIRVGFLYNAARVTFTARPGGDATTPNSVTCDAGTPVLDLNPGRVDPTNTAFDDSRKPIAAEFTFNGETLYIIGVHFNSKGGDPPLFGVEQPPVFDSEVQRIQQAQAVNDFVDTVLACDANAGVIVLGDVNDFQFSAPVATLQGGVLTNMMSLLPANEQYSYVYDGNSEVLDQILGSDRVSSLSPAYDVVHVNSEFINQVSDHDPSVLRLTIASADLSLTKTVDNATPDIGDFVTFTITVDNAGPSDTTGIEVTDLLPAGLAYSSYTTTQGSYNPGTGLWTVGAVANGGSATLQITVQVTNDIVGGVINTAEITASDAGDPDSTPGNNDPAEDDQDSAAINATYLPPGGLYEETHPAFIYNEFWAFKAKALASGGGAAKARNGAEVQFYFAGDVLTIYRRMGPLEGPMQVCIDGVCQLVDNYAPESEWIRPVSFGVFEPGMVSGPMALAHHVSISRVTDRFFFDAVEVTNLPAAVPAGQLVEETHPNLFYVGDWRFKSKPLASGGGWVKTGDQDAALYFRFVGDELTIYRTLGPRFGVMEVCIDGNCQTVDNYSPAKVWVAPWSSGALFNGEHEVIIRNPFDQRITFDALWVGAGAPSGLGDDPPPVDPGDPGARPTEPPPPDDPGVRPTERPAINSTGPRSTN